MKGRLLWMSCAEICRFRHAEAAEWRSSGDKGIVEVFDILEKPCSLWVQVAVLYE